MKYIKQLNLNKNQIFLNFNSKFRVNKNGLIFFGNPIYNKIDEINEKNVKKHIDQVSGFFLCLNLNVNNFFIYNDIGGNFRVYYRKEKNNYFITDNYNNLLKNSLSLDYEQFEFWKNKNYTIGSKTLFNEIKKIPPSSKTLLVKNKIEHDIYFNSNNLKITGDLKTILSKCLNKNLKHLKNVKNKNILLFSGGKDSSLIAQFLKKKKIKFIPVILNTYPKILEFENNKLNAFEIAKENNLNLISIDINLNKIDEKKIVNSMLFDFHFSILHFEGLKKIKKIFGKNINIICGQSADSLFSYGASASTVSHLYSRISFFYNNLFLSFMAKLFLQKKYKRKILFFNIKREYLFFLSFYYYLFVEKKLYLRSNKIRQTVDDLKLKLINKKDFLMYLKIFGFLQGSDNQVVVKSCIINNFNLIMPYMDPQLIYGVIAKKNSIKDIFYPKYPVTELLKESEYISKKKEILIRKSFKHNFNKIESNLKKKFIKEIYKLL
jgi:hypothetical protein